MGSLLGNKIPFALHMGWAGSAPGKELLMLVLPSLKKGKVSSADAAPAKWAQQGELLVDG